MGRVSNLLITRAFAAKVLFDPYKNKTCHQTGQAHLNSPLHITYKAYAYAQVVADADSGAFISSSGFTSPLRQYLSLYRAVYRREVERTETTEERKKCRNNHLPHLLQKQPALALLLPNEKNSLALKSPDPNAPVSILTGNSDFNVFFWK